MKVVGLVVSNSMQLKSLNSDVPLKNYEFSRERYTILWSELAWLRKMGEFEVGLNIKVVGKEVNDSVQLESFSLNIPMKSCDLYRKMTIFGL